ncbi:MAG: ATPase, T2SS/T4P/T4SS family, partial [Planctomycetota bacterium]|nr:ATPase, T2SS/T4P/T4SS family [Planctomycetota bacterium]
GGFGGGGGGGGDPLVLVSFWKPVLVALPLLGWAWVVATIFDKDAQRFYLKRRPWNIGHVVVGAAAVGVALFTPIFWLGWPLMLVILGADLAGYALYRNASDRVPESQKWSFDMEARKKRRADRDAARRAKSVTLGFRGPNGVVPTPAKETPEYQIRAATEEVLIKAVEARASRVEIAPVNEGTYGIAFTVDGVRQAVEQQPAATAVAMIDFLKSAAGLDVSDRRRRLRADMQMDREGAIRTLRVVSMGGQSGLRATVIFDPVDQVRFEADQLGLLENQKKELDALVQDMAGVVLVAAPPHQGRTSTLYALVRAHDAYTTNVQTLETEPEDAIEGVRHNVFDALKDGAEYSTTVRSILRRDPDVVAIAELPDQNTAIEVSKADHDRTRTYAGLRADNALAAIQTYVKAVGDAQKAADSLHGVIAQRLIRRLCQNCRVEYQPSPDLVKKLGASPDKVKRLFKKGGQVLIKNKPEICPVCGGSGFFGQEGIFEIFLLGPEERAMIAKNDLIGLRAAMRKKRLPSIQEAAIIKATQGVTSVEEVARVTSGGSGGGGGKPASKPKPAPAAG